MVLVAYLGESMNVEQINESFRNLTAQDAPYYGVLPTKIAPKDFIGKVLGLHTRDEFPN
jgi:hypothetical protein